MVKQFLRTWKLTITTNSKNGREANIVLEEPIRVTFNLKVTALKEANDGEITVYNLSPETESFIIKEGYSIKLEAGYEDNMALIYVGNILQPLRGKENGTDYFLKLIVMGADDYRNLAFSSGVVNSNLSRRDIALQVLRSSDIEIDTTYINDLPESEIVNGSTPKSERPKVLFGPTSEYIDQIARMGGSSSYVSNKGELKFFNQIKSPDKSYIHEVNISTGMIGMPQKEGYGVQVQTLLQPEVSIGDFIQLDNASILQDQLTLGELPYLLDEDGLYRVISIEYIGDTRGNDWYTSFKTISQNAAIPGILRDEFGATII